MTPHNFMGLHGLLQGYLLALIFGDATPYSLLNYYRTYMDVHIRYCENFKSKHNICDYDIKG
jgi:hypothetical protein